MGILLTKVISSDNDGLKGTTEEDSVVPLPEPEPKFQFMQKPADQVRGDEACGRWLQRVIDETVRSENGYVQIGQKSFGISTGRAHIGFAYNLYEADTD